jgi:imidazolonepropionase-like amidohydrolase
VYVTPTLAFFQLWFATQLSDEEVRSRPDYAHIPEKMRAGYERARAQYWKNPPSEAHRARYIAIRNRMVKAIVDSGGHVMAGSDAPGGLMGYGWSLHRELGMLVDAGLTPMQALAAATRVPAAWLGAEREWGTLEPGRRADLVLLEADPMADIRNTSRIGAVSMGGRWLERPELDDLMEKARIRLHP